MKSKLLALMVLAGGTLSAGTHVSIGVAVGGPAYGYYPPPPPPAVVYSEPVYSEPVYAEPPCPGPGYSWVAGYYYFEGPRRLWRAGYWAPPRYYGPRHYRHEYYEHHRDRDWDRGRDRHDRGWHRGWRERDRDHDRGRGHDRGRRW